MIYLDNNATTPLHESVLEAMLPWLKEGYGNPSSPYRLGREARRALDHARQQVADLCAAHPSQVVFTSGGSEANNYALAGALAALPGQLSVSAVEHPSVLEPARAHASTGTSLKLMMVDAQGRVEVEGLDPAHFSGVVSLMLANNETGVLQPLEQLAERVHQGGGLLHCDAVQGLGKLPLDFAHSGAHLMSLSAHKIGGPKGVGALLVDKSLDLPPLIHGGGQERGRRGGTENLAGLVGFGAAAELAAREQSEQHQRLSALRDQMEARLAARIDDLVIFGQRAERLPNTSFIAVPGLEGQTLIMALDRLDIAVSSGSACGSSHAEPSHVLAAMGVPAELARCAVRISLGRQTRPEDIDTLIEQLTAQVTQLKAFATTAWA